MVVVVLQVAKHAVRTAVGRATGPNTQFKKKKKLGMTNAQDNIDMTVAASFSRSYRLNTKTGCVAGHQVVEEAGRMIDARPATG